jgi:hypothetical protein
MPDPTAAERQRRYRLRRAGLLPPAVKPQCQACGKVHRGAHGALCAACWRMLTPEGREDRARRSREAQGRKRDKL